MVIEVEDDCADCKRLIARYGEENLSYCDYCGHLYHGKYCTCGRQQEAEEEEQAKSEKVVFI